MRRDQGATGPMAINLQAVAKGDNLTGHTMTAATLGGGAATTLVWLLQTFVHVSPPDSVDQWLTAACVFAASYLMQKLSGPPPAS